MGEFGRTPAIGANPRFARDGRDHWPQCYTVLLAGGGIKGGYVHGGSDRLGAYPTSNPVAMENIPATMFTALGLDPAAEVRDPLNRPLPISRGEAVMELFR
jgi:hypothetical protein